MVKKKVTLSIDSKVYSNFQKYCDENAVMLSKKIEIFMDNFIKHSKGKRLTYSLFTGFFIMIALVSLASAGNPDILFVNPTPTTNVTGNSIYVNLSTNSSVEHYSFVDFDNDLVFWMRMDDVNGDVVYENSSYANHGTLINGSYLTIGYYKNATKFDGYNDQIVVPDNSALGLISLTDRITVCAWVNQTGIMTGKYAGVVGQYGNEASENNGNNRGFLLAKSSTDYKYEFMISQDGASRQGVISSTSVNLNKWYHVCGSYNGTNYLIYINGNLDNKSTSSYSSIYDSTSYLGIGNYGYRGVGYENGPAYNGSIDEVLIFKRALSLNEIRAIYNSSAYRFENNYTNLTNGSHTFTGYAVDVNGNLNYTTRTITSGNYSESSCSNDTTAPNVQFVNPTPTTNVSGNSIYVNLSTSDTSEHYSFVDFDNDLVFWMRMDDRNSSGGVLDRSKYGNNGSLLSGAVINSSSGYFGNGSYFNDNGFIEVPDSDSLDIPGLSDRITVCAWFRVKEHGSDYTGIVSRYNTLTANGDRQFLVAKNKTGNKYGFFLSYSGTSFDSSVFTDSELSTNIWYHLCGTSNGTVNLYLNGVKQTQTGTITGIRDSINSSLFIGKFERENSEFNGDIDEVLIFKRALSLNEIRAIYNSSAYRFENNYTNLTNGSHTFTGYAVDVNGNLNYTTRTITSGNGSSENTTLQITLNSPTTQYNSFTVWISTNAAASMCWFSSNNGTTNTTMYENSSTSFYYENFAYGNYSISFYCQNVNGTGTRTDNFQFKRAYVISDHSYVNSQGLRIYFDFGFNYSAEKGPLVIIPDSWTAVKDATWVTEAENYFIARGYAAAPVDTRGKGSSEGTKDAFGYECLDIYELYQYLISNSPYNSYINSSAIYIAGASGAGGKAGVCTSKYPDAFSAGYSSVGVLNLTLWWQTAGSADVAEIVTRVGCNPNQCPEAYLNRDASYLNYNTQTPVMAVSNADDDRVTVNCSRNYNATMILNGKVVNYTEYASGGHTADFTHAHWWFSQHSAERFIPSSGSLLIGGNLHTKNFSIDLNTMNYTASVEYNLPNNSYHTFNITTFGYNKNATVKVFDLAASTNYSVSNGLSTVYIVSDNKGDINLNISLSNYSSTFIIISKVVSEYCGDGICNNGETCSSCASDCGSCPSGGRGGGGGGSRVIPVINTTIGMGIEFGIPGLEIQQISPLVINPGESRKMSASLKNIGTSFLNKCKLIGNENYSSWINSEGTKDLSIGQKAELFFSLNAPKNIKPGRYEVLLSIECQEITKNMTIGIEVIPKKLALELIGAKKDKNNNLRISYSIEELTGEKQEVNVQIVLVGFQSTRLAEVTEKKVIEGNSKITFESVLKLPTNIGEKNLNLLINANSKIASAFVQDYLILDSSSTRGFAIMEGANAGKIITVMLIVAFVVFAFFIGKRIFHLRRMHQRKDILLKISEAIMPYGQASDDKRHRYFNDDE